MTDEGATMGCGDATMHPGGRDRRVASSSPPIRVLYIAAARRHERETTRETSFAYARVDVHTQHRRGIEPARLVSNFTVPSKRSSSTHAFFVRHVHALGGGTSTSAATTIPLARINARARA